MKLYLVHMVGRDTKESFYKVGITNKPDTMLRFTGHGDPSQIKPLDSFAGRAKVEELSKRLAGHIYTHPYEIKILHEVVFKTNEQAEAAEKQLLKALTGLARHCPKKHFTGHTECFVANDGQLQAVIEAMNGLADDEAKKG